MLIVFVVYVVFKNLPVNSLPQKTEGLILLNIRTAVRQVWTKCRNFADRKSVKTMKRTIAYALAALMVSTIALAATKGGDVMRRESDGTCVVNTTSLCADVKGFKGATPVEVYFKKNKIVKVVPLANHETPRFFQKVKDGLLSKWKGMTAAKAATANVDGVTGATFSSKAIKANVKAAATYYKQHK